MLKATDPQLENLMFLRDVVIPWMRENPERVNFDLYNSSCGTYGCLLGWYSMMRHGVEWEQRSIDLNTSQWEAKEFGFVNAVQGNPLFDVTSEAGTLEDRAQALDTIIAERLQVLEAA